MRLQIHELSSTTPADSTAAVAWPDDDSALEAALALIDEWEFDSLASPQYPEAPSSIRGQSPASSPSPSTVDASSTANIQQRKAGRDEAKPVDVQRREELQFLRTKTQELEAQLAAIQEHQSDTATLEDGQGTNALSTTWVWQDIAMRQLKHRQKSEAENTRLRMLVQEQLAVAKQLARVLMRAYREPDKVDGRDTTTSKGIKFPRGKLGEITVEDQRRRVQELYTEQATAFSEPPFTTNRAVFREVNVLEHPNGEMTINVGSSWAVPFPVDSIMDAFWKFLLQKFRRMDCDFHGRVGDGKDEIVTRYESNAVASRLVGKFVGRYVGRRFHSEDGKPALIIGDVCSNPVDFKPMSMEGVKLHQEIIMRIVDVNELQGKGPPTCGPSLSLVQWSSRIRIQFAASGTPTRKRRVDALTNYLFFAVEDELAWKQEVLETLLLKDAMELPSTTV